MSVKNRKGHTARWIQRLQEYNFTSGHQQRPKTEQSQCPFAATMPRECIRWHKVEALVDVKRVRAIVAVASAGWDPAALRREQLNDHHIEPILEEADTEQRPEWKDIADRRPTYKTTEPKENTSLWGKAYYSATGNNSPSEES
jgi:hypothetical protein